MKINIISKQDFFELSQKKTKEFLEKIERPEAFIVKNFYSSEFVLNLVDKTFKWGRSEEASWFPFYDDCPDYHRLHDNYPNAHVKQKFHGFYYHNYFKKNSQIFKMMSDLFILKNNLAGFNDDEFMFNKPSDGIVPRINLHHYPQGGGYQKEHVDPSGPFAQIQTLIIGSNYGIDFNKGGLFARKTQEDEKIYLDQFTKPGDMIVISPKIPHGVDPIDPDLKYSVKSKKGRWIILPLFLFSDYKTNKAIKPKEI